ncbi:tetratricopeptide repeat protein [Marinimicrobium alkaliphilum]|uniref:tetratricopeptide repeat protein n=1 Tax=Marinimicrobium alkaliphilum TaxID=2202654 RepID=UPI000DB9C554|nr:tetratricopeptide repeat protein [Marinimicrobium alkaliphilum]
MKTCIKTFATGAFSKTLLAAALVTTPVVSGLAVQSVAPNQTWFTTGVAQADDRLLRARTGVERQPRRIPALTDASVDQLTEVQDFVQPEEQEDGTTPEPNFEAAIQVLDRLLERRRDRLNQYELSQVYNYYAFIYYNREQYDRAIEAYENVIAQSPQIPLSVEAQTIFTIGQLQMAEERYEDALETFERWADVTPGSINAEQYALFAQLFYQVDDVERSLLHINEAVRLYNEAGRTPQENWYGLQRAIHFEREDYQAVLGVMRNLVRDYPSFAYWRQMSAILGLLEREDDRLHALEATYVMGGLSEERDLLNLAYFLLEKEVPYKAAKILHKGINEDEIIEPNVRNLELLANSWRMAQEIDRSLVEMERAAEKSEDGELMFRLASFYSLNEQFEQVLDSAQEAIRRGGLRREDQAYIVLGTAHFNLGNYEEAVEAFEEAKKDERSETAAEQWIDYTQRERRRQERLRQGAEG